MDRLMQGALKKFRTKQEAKAYVTRVRRAANLLAQASRQRKKAEAASQPIEMGSATSYTGMQM